MFLNFVFQTSKTLAKVNLWNKKKIYWFWILLGLTALLARLFLSSGTIENYYSRGLFLKVRAFLDVFTPFFPVALVYPFLAVLLIFLGYRLVNFIKKPVPLKEKIVDFVFSVAGFCGAVVFFFLILWGFNYGRIPVEKQLDLQSKKINLDDIKREIEYHTAIISNLRGGIDEVNDLGKIIPVTGKLSPENLESVIRKSLVKVLTENNFPVAGKVRCRDLMPRGVLLSFATSGIYFPFTGEGHVDAALHPLQKPFVMAHEMAHGYGFTDEGICNFWAYLACIHSDNLFVRYVGHLNYWRYLASTWKANDPEEYQIFRDKLPPEIQADLDTINESLNKFPDYLPSIRYFAYDTYLKAQGINDGMDNYDRVIPLVISWWEKMKTSGREKGY